MLKMQPARLGRLRIRKVYTWIAPVHDVLGRLVEREARDLAFHVAGLRDGSSILEVAVGTGLNLPYIARDNPGGRYVGIDITPAMLRRARKKLARLHVDPTRFSLEVGDAYELAFSANEFDVLVNSYMFDMLPQEDFLHVLREFDRVLKPGGLMVLINMTKGPRFYHRVWEFVYRLYPPLLGGCRGVDLYEDVVAAGFDVVGRWTVSQWTFPSEVLLCKKPERVSVQ